VFFLFLFFFFFFLWPWREFLRAGAAAISVNVSWSTWLVSDPWISLASVSSAFESLPSANTASRLTPQRRKVPCQALWRWSIGASMGVRGPVKLVFRSSLLIRARASLGRHQPRRRRPGCRGIRRWTSFGPSPSTIQPTITLPTPPKSERVHYQHLIEFAACTTLSAICVQISFARLSLFVVEIITMLPVCTTYATTWPFTRTNHSQGLVRSSLLWNISTKGSRRWR
jgi:hypothetical protein